FAPTFTVEGIALDPEDFGTGDAVRMIPHALPENRSVPTESGSRDWQFGGFLYPGEYDIYVKYGDRAALEVHSIHAASSPTIALVKGVQYSVDLMTKDRATRAIRDLDDLRVSFVSVDAVEGLPNPFNASYPWSHPQVTNVYRYDRGYNLTIVLPAGVYRIGVNMTKDGDLYLLNGTLRNGTFAIVRNFELAGRVYYDRDGDGKRDTNEGVEGVKIGVLGAVDTAFVSGSKGEFQTFLPYGETGAYNLSVVSPGYTGIIDPTAISLPTGDENIALDPLPVSVSGTAFLDQDADGRLDAGEERSIESLEFLSDVEDRVRSVVIDGHRYTALLMPGDYVVRANSEGEATLLELNLDIREELALNLNLTPSVRATGSVFYENMTGEVRLATAEEQVGDLTLTDVDDSDSSIILEVDNGRYRATIPAGEYRVKGTFNIEEFGEVREYAVNDKVDLQEGGPFDIELTRKDKYDVELKWLDATVRALPDSNVTYAVSLRNKGNVLVNVVELSKSSAPGDWTMSIDGKRTLTLEMGPNETVELDVRLYVPGNAKAGVERVRLAATPTEDEGAEETVSMTVNVSAVFDVGVDAVEPVRGITPGNFTHVDFIVTNRGNSPDTYEIDVPALPRQFQATLLNATMAPLEDTNDDGSIDTGQLNAFQGGPIFINVTAGPNAAGTIIIPVTVTSVASGIVRTLELTVTVTLPDLRSELTVVQGDGSDTIYMNATVSNVGFHPVPEFTVEFYMDGIPIGDKELITVDGEPIGDDVQSLAMHENRIYSLKGDDLAGDPGLHTFSFSVVLEGSQDASPDDNYDSQPLLIEGARGDGGEDALTFQLMVVAAVAALLLVAYVIFRRKRRW
ncbi:MAG: NEW3 domain-containing protein, partial [Thermoplasmata archaeon]|nr:NEW3 domain-containing protein [Thermoplasmata archaeon]